ncbi:serine/threonine-protein kinase Atg1p [Trichomonascus vanleenenianus]|uniref:serine/threonine protein kinase ATG1 n=1 Tax=Trichomonascus vanleenenianus TaxID=2268995 RepID=UPI003EC9CEC1
MRSEELRIGAEIGRGSFASVYKGEYRGRAVAVKSVLRGKLNKKLMENLESEISILKDMKHPHVVALLDYRRTTSHFHLVMEYCALGDLSYFIRKRKEISKSLPLVASLFERYPSPQGLHEDVARHFLKQLASALAFLRSRDLVHRDIKPQNLLLCPPMKSRELAEEAGYVGQWELPVLKLADFGFARILPSTSLAETLCGSPLYMAPEILSYKKYDAKADLWSVGAVLYEMVAGRPPFKASNHVELLKRIEKVNDQIQFSETIMLKTSAEMRRLIKALLKRSPTERMSYSEFFNDPILREDEGDIQPSPLDRSNLDENLFISEYVDKTQSSAIIEGDEEDHPEDTSRQYQQQLQQAHQPYATKQNPSQSLLKESPSNTSSITNRRIGVPTTTSQSLDNEYVVVEKRTVEVNALADELARSPTRLRNPSRSPPSQKALERRSSVAYGTSPTSALARALSMASARLFGTKVDTFGATTVVSPPPQFAQGALVPQEERKLLEELDSLATKAKVVNLFAEVKFSQLIPSAPDADISLTPEGVLLVSEEALVLYVKTLSLLAAAMNKAASWWKANETREASMRLNDTVQWIRDRFNESLEKAEYAQSLLEDARSRLGSSGGSAASSAASELSKPITAEKLVFDRALEMSRAAAVNELSGEDLDGCELSYGTAVWMLEALLEGDGGSDDLDDEDRQVVEKFIASITHRLFVLRKKLNQQKQLSIAGGPSSTSIYSQSSGSPGSK